MQYQHYDLGQKEGGETVIVSLSGNAANVKLLSDSDFHSYRRRARHNYYGGYYKQSPARITIPSSGHWHITVDLGGYSGRVSSSVRVID